MKIEMIHKINSSLCNNYSCNSDCRFVDLFQQYIRRTRYSSSSYFFLQVP
ncbi:unnamed protein product [Arabidopsis halleri]